MRGTCGIGSRPLSAGAVLDLDPIPVGRTSVRPLVRLAPRRCARCRALGTVQHVAQTAQSPPALRAIRQPPTTVGSSASGRGLGGVWAGSGDRFLYVFKPGPDGPG